MSREALKTFYRSYIDCLNRQDWTALGDFVHPEVVRNEERLGLEGYRLLLEGDVRAIPDLRFTIDLLVADPPLIAARLLFDCTPTGILFGLPVHGRRVRFSEAAFYRLEAQRIVEVRSLIDTAAIAAQL
jgi:Predicted ester cyclase